MWDPEEACGVNVAAAVFGGKWKPTIIWLLSQGRLRFAALRRAAGDISEKVLAEQLRELQRDGIVHRDAGKGFPLYVEYSLTKRGIALNEALEPVAAWGDENLEHLRLARQRGATPQDLAGARVAAAEGSTMHPRSSGG